MAYICYGLNLVQTHRRKIHQYGEQRLNIRSYSCVFLGNVLMIKMRILVKTFVVYALPLLSHQSYNSANMTCSDELINFCYVKNWKSHLWRMFMMQRKIWGVGTNYDILIMKFKRGPAQSFSTGSAVYLLLEHAQGSERAPQAKGAAEANTKEQELAELWLSMPKASASAAERVGEDNELTQRNRGWQPCSSPQEQQGAGTELWLSLAIWSLLCSRGCETMPCPSP